MPTLARALVLSLLLFLLAGCSTDRQTDSGHGAGLSRPELLAELDALETPAGADAQQFAELKSAFKAALAESLEDKFEVHPPRGPHSVVTDLTLAILPDGSPGIQWSYVNPGDYNFDGQTNLTDLVHLGAFLGSHTGRSDWERAAHVDYDGNGVITMADMIPIAVNFLGTVTAWQVYSLSLEGGEFLPLTQVPMGDGQASNPTGVPRFSVAISEPWATFKVHALDPLGQSSGPSVDSQWVSRASRVHVLDSPYGPQLLARDGMLLVIRPSAISPPENQIKPGDVLLNPASNGFVMRVLEAVGAAETVTVQCIAGDLTDLFASGLIELRIVAATLGQPASAHFENVVLRNDSHLMVVANSGSVTFDAAGSLLAGLGTDGHLSHYSGALFGNYLNVVLDLAAFGNAEAPPFPESEEQRSNYEKLLKSSRATGQAEIAPGIKIPIEVTFDLLLGIEGEGEIVGDHYLSLSGSFEIQQSGGTLDFEGNNWQPRHLYLGEYANRETPVISETSGNFKLRPYFKVRTTLRLFPEAEGVRLADWVTEQVAFTELAATKTETPMAGFNIEQSSWLDATFRASLASVGVFNLDADLAHAGSKQVFHSGFVPGTSSPLVSYTISGTVFDWYELSTLQGVTLRLLEQGTLSELASTLTGEDGAYSFGGIEAGTAVRVVPEHHMYYFTPTWAEFVVSGDLGQDFTAYPGSSF